MQNTKIIEAHPVLGEVREWTHKGSEQNIWRGGDVRESGNFWHFCKVDCQLDGWFTPTELRAIADYMDGKNAVNR